MAPSIWDIWNDVADFSYPYDRDVRGVLESVNGMYTVLQCRDYLLPPDQQARFENHVDRLLLTYRSLHIHAQTSAPPKRMFHEVPKFHWLQHIKLQSRFVNPRLSWCYADEDFMGIMKKMSMKCLAGTAATKVAAKIVERWVSGICVRLAHQYE